MARRRRHRNARRVVVVNAPRRRRRRRIVHRARRRHNPPRYHRRRHHRRRHNPSRAASRVTLTRPMSWLPYVFTGGAAATVSAFAPKLVFREGPTAQQAYFVQAGVAAAGAIVLPFLGLRGWHPLAWMVGAGAPIVADLVGRQVAGWLGLGWYPYQALHQSPYYPPRLYAGHGVGMYPFEGGSEVFTYPEQSFVGAPEAPFEHMFNN